ncbi:unnamed protein product [Allacma fusca]|uniref:Uncharacterized protein n=1 Tax=Allacma fusca TaxID=39272 RepID=A0A8J2JCV3_9HEXA|nr:unnamed protein product [Allacma fusca]
MELKETDTYEEKLHIENLTNQWAMWLDSMSENLKLVHVNGEALILEYFADFESDMLSKISAVSKFESGPVECIRLGKLYEARGDFFMAKPYFDKIISSEPDHCDVAHYYKAALLLKQNPSETKVKRQAIRHLKYSYRLLKKRMNQLVSSLNTFQITCDVRRLNGEGTMCNRYQKQVENELELYQVQCGKIEEAVRVPITSATFKTLGFNDKDSTNIFQVLRKNPAICKNYRLSKKVKFNVQGDIIIDETTTVWPPALVHYESYLIQVMKSLLGDPKNRVMEDNAFCVSLEKTFVTRKKF